MTTSGAMRTHVFAAATLLSACAGGSDRPVDDLATF